MKATQKKQIWSEYKKIATSYENKANIGLSFSESNATEDSRIRQLLQVVMMALAIFRDKYNRRRSRRF